jgi:hypothetical protein
MIPPKCRVCGVAEWSHVCGGAVTREQLAVRTNIARNKNQEPAPPVVANRARADRSTKKARKRRATKAQKPK